MFSSTPNKVAGLRQEVYGEERRRKEGEEETRFSASSSGRLYLSREIDQLRQQVIKIIIYLSTFFEVSYIVEPLMKDTQVKITSLQRTLTYARATIHTDKNTNYFISLSLK